MMYDGLRFKHRHGRRKQKKEDEDGEGGEIIVIVIFATTDVSFIVIVEIYRNHTPSTSITSILVALTSFSPLRAHPVPLPFARRAQIHKGRAASRCDRDNLSAPP